MLETHIFLDGRESKKGMNTGPYQPPYNNYQQPYQPGEFIPLQQSQKQEEQMETIRSSDGAPIAYQRSGQGAPLVLLHGTTADHTRWAPVLPTFQQSFTAHAVHRRGRAGSTHTEQ